MKRLLAGIEIALLVALIATNTGGFEVQQTESKTTAIDQLAALPLAFEPNLGQAGDPVEYLVHHGKATTYFTPSETVTTVGDEQLRMNLEGSNPNPIIDGADELPSKTNYFIGNDQSKWQPNVPNFKQLFMEEVYPGIDLKYYGNNQQALEHDFIVAPGSDPSQIAMRFEGQKNVSLGTDGSLKITFDKTELELRHPTTYQEVDGRRQFVDSSYNISSSSAVRIALGNYDSTRPLIIDPVLSLAYSTYLGGSVTDQSFDMTTDSANSAYIIGTVSSTNFPTLSPFQASNAGGRDISVTKLNAAGSAIIYSTYLGGTLDDFGRAIALDTSGNAYLTGSTASTDFPTQSPFQATHGVGGGNDVFVTKLNSTGSALAYSTYLGGDGANDVGRGIVVDTSGNAYVTGNTSSTDFPTQSPFQSSFSFSTAGFVTKFDSSGSTLIYSTYLGGTDGGAVARSITIDTSGNAYVTGSTSDTTFPTASPFQASNGGSGDAFVTKFNSGGSALIYSTYLGGSGTENGFGIALDTSGNTYITGDTTSTNFPTASPYQSTSTGSTDAFATKLNSTGSALTYSTYLGGSGADSGRDIAVDLSSNAHIVGSTDSTNFPTGSPYQAANGGASDAFVTKLSGSGASLAYATYLGGSGSDIGYGIAVDANRNAYVAGETGSGDFPTSSPFQATNAGGIDIFLTKITDQDTANLLVTVAPVLTFALNVNLCDFGHLSYTQTKFCNHTVAASTNASGGYVISYIPTTTLTSGANTITDMSTLASSTLASEQFGLNFKANTAAGSFTAVDFGADESGGAGFVVPGYDIGDLFKFDTGGDDIAQSTSVSATTTFTASYIANITGLTEPGTYGTLMTYNIVASY